MDHLCEPFQKKNKKTPFNLPGDPIWEGLREKTEIFKTLMGTIIGFDWFAWFVFTFISHREMCMSKIITSTTTLIWLVSFFAHYPYQCIFLFDEAICILFCFHLIVCRTYFLYSHVDFEVIFDSCSISWGRYPIVNLNPALTLIPLGWLPAYC